MKLATEFYSADFSQKFSKFAQIVNESSWSRVLKSVNSEIKGNPFLGTYLRRQHRIAYALERIALQLKRYGRLVESVASSEDLYEASALVVQSVDLLAELGARESSALAGRMRGALKNTVDMRALQFELQVATHLAKSGFDLGFPQAIGASNVDILAVRNELELEVECKFISIDKGRSVHRREALEIHHLLKKRVFPVFANASVGILIRVQFHERPPKKYKDREALVDHIRRVALGGTPGTEFGCSISTVEFDVGSSPFSSSRPTAEAAQEFFGGFGVRNRETAIFANIGKCVLAISLESEREDDLLGQVFDTVADAATRQLSGDHPGVICVKFEDLPAAQLKDIADENGEPTPLRIAASRFLDSASAKNVSMLSFFADDRVEDIGGGVVTRAGSVYSFPRPVGEFHKAKELEAIFTKTEK